VRQAAPLKTLLAGRETRRRRWLAIPTTFTKNEAEVSASEVTPADAITRFVFSVTSVTALPARWRATTFWRHLGAGLKM
jgi:hypothetical protein